MALLNEVIITISCPFCGKQHDVHVDEGDYYSWQNGELIQSAMPYLSATEREQLISHICPSCQTSIFGEDPEDDKDEGDDIDACMRESLEFTGQWW